MNQKAQDILTHTTACLEGTDLDEMPDDRRAFFEGLEHLSKQHVDLAIVSFKQATHLDPPFNKLASLALAECERIQGRSGRALKRLKALLKDASEDALTRQAALLAQLQLYDEREDSRSMERTLRALDDSHG